jgi:hypothetical protein
MPRLSTAAMLTVLLVGAGTKARGDDAANATAIIDKAVKALGGEEKLSKVKAVHWKADAKFRFGDNDSEGKIEVTAQSPDHVRRVFEGEFGGNQVRGVTVLAGDHGWRKFGDNKNELDSAAVANEKRSLYLSAVAAKVLQLKTKHFKVTVGGDEMVNGKPASVLKATGPDGKDFSLYLDKQTGLPVKEVARVVGFRGDEYTQETTFSDYKEMDGIKKATKMEIKRDGQPYQQLTITEYKVLDKVDSKTFAEPE